MKLDICKNCIHYRKQKKCKKYKHSEEFKCLNFISVFECCKKQCNYCRKCDGYDN